MIISLRGTNGSGKSTVVLKLMDQALRVVPAYGVLGLRKPEAYNVAVQGVTVNVYALGPYPIGSLYRGFDDRMLCGNYDYQLALVRKYAGRGHAIFEGLVVSKVWGRMGQLLEELAPQVGVSLLYLSTPVEECIRRVVARRNCTEPFSEKNLRAVYDQVRSNLASVRQKQVEGLHVEEVSSEDAPARVLELLEAA